jgi:hypothetical protein
MWVLLYDDDLGSRPSLLLWLKVEGVGFTWKIESVQLYGTQTPSLLALFTRFDSISIFELPRYWPPGSGPLAEWADSCYARLFLSSKSMIRGAHGTKYRHAEKGTPDYSNDGCSPDWVIGNSNSGGDEAGSP